MTGLITAIRYLCHFLVISVCPWSLDDELQTNSFTKASNYVLDKILLTMHYADRFCLQLQTFNILY